MVLEGFSWLVQGVGLVGGGLVGLVVAWLVLGGVSDARRARREREWRRERRWWW